jgi:hypothetical protein
MPRYTLKLVTAGVLSVHETTIACCPGVTITASTVGVTIKFCAEASPEKAAKIKHANKIRFIFSLVNNYVRYHQTRDPYGGYWRNRAHNGDYQQT